MPSKVWVLHSKSDFDHWSSSFKCRGMTLIFNGPKCNTAPGWPLTVATPQCTLVCPNLKRFWIRVLKPKSGNVSRWWRFSNLIENQVQKGTFIYNLHIIHIYIYCLIPLHWGISLPRWSDTGCETYPPGNWIEGQDVPKWGQEASIRMKITGTRVCPIWRILSSALEIVHTILCWRRLSSVEKTIS